MARRSKRERGRDAVEGVDCGSRALASAPPVSWDEGPASQQGRRGPCFPLKRGVTQRHMWRKVARCRWRQNATASVRMPRRRTRAHASMYWPVVLVVQLGNQSVT